MDSLNEQQLFRPQNLRRQKRNAFISLFFSFTPLPPKYTDYKGSWQDFYSTRIMIATENATKT